MLPYLAHRSTAYTGDWMAFRRLIDSMSQRGYTPLIMEANRRFREVFRLPAVGTVPLPDFRLTYDDESSWYYQGPRGAIRRAEEAPEFPETGELFYAHHGKAIFCLTLRDRRRHEPGRARRQSKVEASLQLGCFGSEVNEDEVLAFLTMLSEELESAGEKVNWRVLHPANRAFESLKGDAEAKFVLANDLPNADMELADVLSDTDLRGFAVTLRRSGGGILTSELERKSGLTTEALSRTLEGFRGSGLVASEFVVICRNTSNQVNRVGSRDRIDRMSELGVKCSCGRDISQERIEELVVPSVELQRMLDQSYWMTLHLVKVLIGIGVARERILLNLHEGAEEVDALADVEGTLVMFELKDSEFSMGHAYPFTARIGLYKPDFAYIVSTKGVAPEVKDYLRRYKPGAMVMIVENLDALAASLQGVTSTIRVRRARELAATFEPFTSTRLGMGDLANQLGLTFSSDVEVRRLVQQGQKIEAIKVYRQLTNASLKEAKDAVEAME